MRKWLSRLSFSFLILSAAAGFEAWRGYSGQRPARAPAVNALLVGGAIAGFVLFLAGTKARHARDDDRLA